MDVLNRDEAIFYTDQQGERRHLLSQDIDLEYDNEMEADRAEKQLNEEAFQRELAFIAEEEETFISLKKGNRKSVTEKTILVNKGCQSNIKVNDAPDIRKIKNTIYEINDAISTVSS